MATAASQEAARHGSKTFRNGYFRPIQARNEVHIRYVCVEGHNLIDELELSDQPQISTVLAKNLKDTLNLGFVCQRVHAREAGAYDWHIYMEDDLTIHDPMLLEKLSWFADITQGEGVLVPNRFEYSFSHKLKNYVDGPNRLKRDLQKRNNPSKISRKVLGRSIQFERPINMHGGFWAMTAEQLQHCMKHKDFGAYNVWNVAPLESAATAPELFGLSIYKPTMQNPDFAEIEHTGQRFMDIATG